MFDVVLFSYQKTGSGRLQDIFNKRNDFIYRKEPIGEIPKRISQQTFETLNEHVEKSFHNCPWIKYDKKNNDSMCLYEIFHQPSLKEDILESFILKTKKHIILERDLLPSAISHWCSQNKGETVIDVEDIRHRINIRKNHIINVKRILEKHKIEHLTINYETLFELDELNKICNFLNIEPFENFTNTKIRNKINYYKKYDNVKELEKEFKEFGKMKNNYE